MENNPFMKRAASRGTTEHGRTSERRVSKSLGGKLQPGSGAPRGAKSDFKVSKGKVKFRFESKSTVKLSMILELSWLTKIAYEASSDGSIPALTLSFVTPDGKPRTDRNADWVCIPGVFLQELLEGIE